MSLKAAEIRASQPRKNAYKMADERGLFLLIQPSGARLWRLKYRFRGYEKKLNLGKYPEIGLAEARERRDEARRLLASGIDPAVARKQAALEAAMSQATTFRVVADEYIEKMACEGKADSTLVKMRWFRDLLEPDIGHRPIAEITPHELLDALRRVERRGHRETAHRLRAFADRVFRYAIVTLRATASPADILRGALTAPKVTHRAAVLEPRKVGELLRAIDGYEGRPETRIALQLAPHLFVRPGELRKAEWSEFDLDQAVWRIPGEKMKMAQPHMVPLSQQSLELVRQLRSIANHGVFLFPAFHTSKRYMCENTLNQALRRLGYANDEMTAHGFRAIASTFLNESGLWNPDAIERALAHRDRNAVRAAYHRSTYWAERVRMAQWWSDHLDELRAGGTVIVRSFGRAG
ncbi:tyrosine-type recombinase/integrase [Sphingosinicella microcystinivorans]|uniref:tyrosine-type recombinase/integrase n=1 Tax=Sphingosinicella microcystinivorans TaxID=335406 RepID=UPI0022F3BF5C|nr:integrase arm-type DNA-binding domain-containing protein [Sphingosinicella microcystinivorans]WBX82861.1 tyrosine-type recombinase/integrase [Sphingosinicella microcystinivorans]